MPGLGWHAVSRRRALRRLTIVVLALAGSLLGAAPAAASPTINLTQECRSAGGAYGFSAWLSGFPPNLPFHAVVRWQDQDQVYDYSTDANGGTPTVGGFSDAPLGLVKVTVTVTIDGTQQVFVKKLLHPCTPPLTLTEAMCGDHGYAFLDFASFAACAEYARQLQRGAAVPKLKSVAPVCDSASSPPLVAVNALVLGIPPGGTQVTLLITTDQGSHTIRLSPYSNRFGILRGTIPSLVGPTQNITLTVSWPGVTLTASLNASDCAGKAPGHRRTAKHHRHGARHHASRGRRR